MLAFGCHVSIDYRSGTTSRVHSLFRFRTRHAILARQEPTSSAGEETNMEQPGLDQRHRDKNGRIAKKHGNTLVSTLRNTYGSGFAPGIDGKTKLIDVLHKLDEPSLSKLIDDLSRNG
jgi:hypothetical protein